MTKSVICAVLFLVFAFSGRLFAEDVANEDDILKHLKAAEGLSVSVWARSPMFFNPTGMDVDEKGRIWVSEAVNYRGFRTKKNNPKWHEEGDRIVILEDTNQDGTADSSKLFVQDKDLTAPLGVTVVGNKVVVSCSPHLLVYTKNDKDEVVKKEKFLSGWGGLDHDHSLHKIEVGPDGRWYLNAGNAGPHVVSGRDGWTLRTSSWYRDNRPEHERKELSKISDDGRLYCGGVLLSIRPDGTGMQVLGYNYRNPYGHGLDSFGNVWLNDNDDTQSCRTGWIMRFGNSGYNSRDGARSWRADQRPGQSIPNAHWRQDDPGVIPSGHVYGNGSPTGLAYYENGILGERYSGGLLLSCEAGQNVVWGYRRVVDGAGFKLEGFPLLSSTGVQDPDYEWKKRESNRAMWFRPSDVIVGADGAVYICDWYDAVVGGHQMDDRESVGTIYRVSATAAKPIKAVYKTATDYLKNPAPSIRNIGYRAFAEQGNEALPSIKKLLASSDRFIRARATWVLAAIGEGGIKELTSLLKDKDPEIRTTAFRALEQVGKVSLAQRAELAADTSLIMRREVALSMRDESFADARDILLKLASSYKGNDRWYLEAIGTGCEGKELEMYAVFLAKLGSPTATWTKAFSNLAWRLHPVTSIPAFKDRALNAELSVEQRKQAMDAIAFTAHKRSVKAMEAVANEGPEDLRDYAVYWLNHRAKNDWNSLGAKPVTKPEPKRAISTKLSEQHFQSEVLKKGSVDIDIDITGASRLQLIATDGGDGKSSDWVNWLNPTLVDKDGKSHDLTRLNWSGAETGFGTIHKGMSCQGTPLKVDGKTYKVGLGGHAPMRVDYTLPGQSFVRLIVRAAVDDGSVDKGGATHKDKKASVVFRVHHDGYTGSADSPIAAALKLKGNAARGEKIFASMACVTCHTFKKQGREFGPDLTKIGEKFAPPALMEAITEPNAGILLGYEAVLIETKDKKTLYGFVLADGDMVTLKDISGTEHSIPKKNISRREAQKTSLMPRMPFEAQALADLTAYLRDKGK